MDIEVEISKLSPKQGDVVVVKVNGPMLRETAVNLRDALRKSLDSAGIEGVSAMVLDKGCDLALLDEDAMRQAGWVRAPDAEATDQPAAADRPR